MNPNYKTQVKETLDRMLEFGIISPIDNTDWISPMVIQYKMIGDLRICVDFKELNKAYEHDPFLT